jgi:hypothetical protein
LARVPTGPAQAQRRHPATPPRDFRKHGEKAVAQVRRKQPAAYQWLALQRWPGRHVPAHGNRLNVAINLLCIGASAAAGTDGQVYFKSSNTS